jgi:AcrR family transcriptional regulator
MAKSTYHHGALAADLIAAALCDVEARGAKAVSLRELAQALGVSHGAPYRHFADRDALLAAVAARGFDDLIGAYQAALGLPGDGPIRLRAVGRAFFEFALGRPGLYRLMFESEFLNRPMPPAVLAGPADAAYRLLWQAVGAAFPEADEVEVKVRTLIMISTSHGFLALNNAGRFRPFMYEPLTPEQMVDAVMHRAIGLGREERSP